MSGGVDNVNGSEAANVLALPPAPVPEAQAKTGSYLGRPVHLLKAAGFVGAALLLTGAAVASAVLYVGLRVLAACAMITIIGIPIALALWPVYELTWYGTGKSAAGSLDTIRNAFKHIFQAVA